ncbi:MAG: sulfite exporter TauE/SafE family protein [Sphingomonadaceae bacterium]|uniref:sulfite exporter TauE/SafE family protein n=1 Tax=Thermaurantiacus sp. TaxID=2820283 RepID=UPI00298F20EC|nr:sulfite exporter TauE/SafE family protein [Thermaurantiacus sp.]MCS6987456.1 sulfite exporter TauE/SafE family protein [Sphingomonadaceae bacterium]MDW8415376.1 sulfite exporter TauE/SafE family protein [Thermaurantiacus sp.]
MEIYLPIAEMSVSAPLMVLLGFGVGFLSGMFGVGGGFLTTPLLIVTGIPPAVAVASSATQVTGSSVTGAIAHWRARALDPKMGLVMTGGGFVGAALGSALFRWLTVLGQVDVVIALAYVALLGTVGSLMLKESLEALARRQRGEAPPRPARRHHPLVAALPWPTRFPRSGLYISPLAPALLGAAVGVLTVLTGVGGGFILVPGMLYLLGMSAGTVVGTSLFQILFVSALTTVLHAVQSQTVDIVLAGLLLVGGVVGARLGTGVAQRLAPERLRLALALLVLAVAARLFVGLTWRPGSLFVAEVASA